MDDVVTQFFSALSGGDPRAFVVGFVSLFVASVIYLTVIDYVLP